MVAIGLLDSREFLRVVAKGSHSQKDIYMIRAVILIFDSGQYVYTGYRIQKRKSKESTQMQTKVGILSSLDNKENKEEMIKPVPSAPFRPIRLHG